MELIENVITNDELGVRLEELCNTNWKIKSMSEGLMGNSKAIIDNWFPASRPSLLKMLNLKENEEYKFVYHNIE